MLCSAKRVICVAGHSLRQLLLQGQTNATCKLATCMYKCIVGNRLTMGVPPNVPFASRASVCTTNTTLVATSVCVRKQNVIEGANYWRFINGNDDIGKWTLGGASMQPLCSHIWFMYVVAMSFLPSGGAGNTAANLHVWSRRWDSASAQSNGSCNASNISWIISTNLKHMTLEYN